MTAKRTDVKPFEYMDVGAKIPNYTPGAQWGSMAKLSKMQKPIAAEESMKHLVVPQGFPRRTVCVRARHRWQADLHGVGRTRPAVGRRNL